MRQVENPPGDVYWVNSAKWLGYASEPHGQRVRFVKKIKQVGVLVAGGGEFFTLPGRYLDPGREFQTASGRWIPESDRRVRGYLTALHRKISQQIPHDCDRLALLRDHQVLADIWAIMQRNGWGGDVPRPATPR